MRKLKLFSREQVGNASDAGRQYSRPDSLSLVSRQSVLAFLLVLLTSVFGVGNVWGETFSQVYDYETQGSGTGKTWTLSNCTDQTDYWQCPTGNNITTSVASITGIFTGKTITSDVTITISNGTYGSGTNPSAKTFTIYNSSACTSTSQVTASNNGTFASSKTYVNTVYTVTAQDAAKFSNDLAILITKPGKTIRLKSITVAFTYTPASAGPANPTVSLNPDDKLNFATVGVGDEAPEAQSFTITGSHMTAALSIADLTNFDYSVTSGSLSPSEGSISATVTVTPKSGFTASAGNKSETLKISGDDLDNDKELALNAEVKAKHNIIFDTDLKSIANVSVMEGETYDITETIEADLIASCTYTKFEGWTTATSIADPSVKPELVNSVTMSTADVTLKPVFSKTVASGGINGSTIIDYSKLGLGSYGDGTEKDTYSWSYTQLMKGSNNTIQGNSSKKSILWNTIDFPAAISKVELVVGYAAGAANTAALSFGLEAKPTSNVIALGDKTSYALTETGTLTIEDSIPANSTYVSLSWTNGASYFTSLKVYYGSDGTTTYSLDPGCAAAGQCHAPTFSPAAGTFDVAQNVELASTTDGATIRYTIDGSTPSKTVGTVYSSAIPVSANTTIKAIAYKEGMTDSEISEGVFNIRYAQPTFSLEEGEYTTAQNVIISADGADAIYYAIGETPTIDEEHKYTAPIAINTTGSHTINAIAVKAGYANSNVASATYVMDLPYGSIAEFIAGAPTAAAKDLVFEAEDNCVITGINGTTIYIQDASGKGIMIFGLSSLPTNAAVNHQITGTINAKYTSFKGQHEMTNVDFSGASISEDPVSRPTPAAVTAIDATKFNEHTMVLVSIENLYYKSSSYKTHKFATTEGGSTEYTIYDQFGIMSEKTMPETSVACNLTGILSVFNTTYQLLPVFATDIVADADAAAPTVSPAGGADAENAVTAAAVEITAAAGTKVDGQASMTVDINFAIPTEVTVDVTRDFYRSVNYSCGWYKAAAAKYNINGQGATTEGTVVAKVAGVEAATAAEGDEVHVFITPNTHFHLATIKVNGNDPTKVTAGEEYSFTMPGEAVTIAVTWTEDEKATLTFAKGDANGEEAAPGNIVDYIGETIQLPANPFTYTGHKFAGWSCDGGTTKLAAGANYVLAEDKAFVAQWDEIPTFDNSGYEWQLVTSDAQLVAGKYYVIASTAKGKVMSNTISSNVAGEIAATFTDGVIAYNAFGSSQSADAAGVAVLQLGVEADAWTLTEVVANDALLGATAVKKIAWGSGTTTWSISFANNNATIQNGTASYGRILHNVQNTRFTTYTSDPAADMLLPQLYVWAEKVYKLRYDANGGENAPAAQPADGEGKATVTDAKPTKEDYIFKEWNTLVGGDGEAKAAGAVIDLSAGDVTLYAQWRTPEIVKVSYDANGGEGTMDADENQTEGSTYTIKTNTFERNGYLFVGWKAYDANDVELTITNGKFTVPATDVTLKAQWHSATDSKWVLVEYLSQLADGDKVIIAAAGSDYALGAEAGSNNKYRAPEAANKAGKLLIPTAGVTRLTLGKSGDYYTFKDDDNYLMWSSGNTLPTEASVSDNSRWTISFEEGVMHIYNVKDSDREIQYNATSGTERFATYEGGQKAIVLYKYLDIDPEVATSGYEREDLVLSGIGTICLPYDVKASDRFGGVFYMPSHKTSGFANFVEETGTLKAGKAYIFVAENEFIRLKYSGDEVSEPLSNVADTRGLIGTFTGYGYGYTGNLEHKYVVANNKLMECGSGAWVNPYRAYLDLEVMPEEALVINDGPGAAPRRRLGIGGNAPTVPTGFENVQGDNGQCTKVLINGELFILRGEKMYDAKGQLVK